MSDNESSDGMDDLKELLAVYAKQEEKAKPHTNQKRKHVEPSYVEVPMEKVLFGDKETFLANLAKAVGKKRPKSNTNNQDDDKDSENLGHTRKPAWTDSDDDELQVGDVKRRTRHTGPLKHLRKDKSYKEYLTARFARTVNQADWASMDRKNKDDDSDESEDEPLLRTVGFIDHKAKSLALRPTNLFFKRMKDINRFSYREKVITSIQFHPTSTAALVVAENSIASIYTVDGQKNEKLHGVRFPNFKLTCARITPCGTKAYFGSFKRFYFSYDLLEAKETMLYLPKQIRSFRRFEISPCGKYIASAGDHGAIHLFTTISNELLHSFKQDGDVRGMCFTEDSKRLICNGVGGNVNILSLKQNVIEHKFSDDGCINGQTLQLSPNQRLLATGSNEGVVNVYDYESVYQTINPTPEKRFMNLRTAITDVCFNHSSELLAMCSREVPEAVKIAHFPSATIYSNFPVQQTHLGKICTMAFSPTSGFFALGNMDGKVPLFRLKYFKNY